MDNERKKQLILEYKNRKPHMGIIAVRCIPTGEIFLGRANDIKAGCNSIFNKLESDWHPNKVLLGLWNKYGKDNFEIALYKELKYDEKEPKTDYSDELEKMLEKCLEENEKAERIW